jgi:hypothetical protein
MSNLNQKKKRKIIRIYTKNNFKMFKILRKITRTKKDWHVAKECEGRLNVFKKLSYPDYRQIWLNVFYG